MFSLTAARLRLASLDLFTCTFSRDQSELSDGPPRQRNDTAASSLRRGVRQTLPLALTAIVRHTWRSGDPRAGIRRQPRTTVAREILPALKSERRAARTKLYFLLDLETFLSTKRIAACLKAPSACLRNRPRHRTHLRDSPPPSLKRNTTRRVCSAASRERKKTSHRWDRHTWLRSTR